MTPATVGIREECLFFRVFRSLATAFGAVDDQMGMRRLALSKAGGLPLG